MTAGVGIADIRAAQSRIAQYIKNTPTVPDRILTDRLGLPVTLKLEYRQETGAFKLRGATNAVLSLPESMLACGVVTASTGNHGRAVAHAARAQGARAVVCLSCLVPANKVESIRALGAEVRIIGESQDEAMEEVARAVADEGMTEIPPFDHPDVVAGQGTLGLEIVAQCPDVETVLVPLSGGGLAAGVSAAVKAHHPAVRVIGISMERGAAMAASLSAGHPVAVRELPTLADSLGGGIGADNAVTFAMCRALLDDVVLLTEAEIAEGIRHIHRVTGDAIEGAAAVGVGALLAGKVTPRSATVAIASGRNIDPALHARILAGANSLEDQP